MFTAQIAQQGGLVAGNVRHRDIIQIAVGASEDRGRLFFKRHRRELSLLQQFRQARTAIEQLLGRSVEVRAASCERSEEHTSELQSLMRNSYAVFCLKKKPTLHLPRHK